MTESFRKPLRPAGTPGLAWQSWRPATFEAAARADRPIFLHLSVGWCDWCRRMDETTFTDPHIVELLSDRVVAVRVDADRFPHIQDRYIAGGWPTNAFLTPTGELLWSATYVEAAELAAVAAEVLNAWANRRSELQLEIARRQRALEAARNRRGSVGLVRRSAADDVVAVALDNFDERHGGFGGEPKFPPAAAIELFYRLAVRGAPEWAGRADLTLDGMLAGELLDREEGGFYRYALAADWTQPRREKLLETNAGLLRAYALGAQLRDRRAWRSAAEGTVEWVERVLARPDGLWAGSQNADDAYFAADTAGRAALPAPRRDDAVLTSWNARWIAALADAGGRLERSDWIERAAAGLDALTTAMGAPGDLMHHFRADGEEPQLAYLLDDTLHTALAAMAVAQATGSDGALGHARRLAAALEREFWTDAGGFHDRARGGDELGLLRFRDRPFEANSEAARLFLDLAAVTGERGYRACAETVLAMLSPAAGRYGIGAAVFAIAVDEFFHSPLRIFIVDHDVEGERDDDAARTLRSTALALPRVDRRVFSVANGTRLGPLHFDAAACPAAFVCDLGSCSPPITEPTALAATVLVPG